MWTLSHHFFPPTFDLTARRSPPASPLFETFSGFSDWSKTLAKSRDLIGRRRLTFAPPSRAPIGRRRTSEGPQSPVQPPVDLPSLFLFFAAAVVPSYSLVKETRCARGCVTFDKKVVLLGFVRAQPPKVQRCKANLRGGGFEKPMTGYRVTPTKLHL